MEEAVNRWTLPVIEDESGEFMIELPPELLAQAGWQPGDVLEWIELDHSAWQLKKKNTTCP